MGMCDWSLGLRKRIFGFHKIWLSSGSRKQARLKKGPAACSSLIFCVYFAYLLRLSAQLTYNYTEASANFRIAFPTIINTVTSFFRNSTFDFRSGWDVEWTCGRNGSGRVWGGWREGNKLDLEIYGASWSVRVVNERHETSPLTLFLLRNCVKNTNVLWTNTH